MNFTQKAFLLMLKSAPETTVLMSRHNCHQLGLDSVVVDNDNGKLTRAFFAHKNHDMWKNNVDNIQQGHHISLGIHDHKYDLLLTRLYGKAYNISVEPQWGGDSYNLYEYSSMLNGEGKVSKIGKVGIKLESYKLIEKVFIPQHTLHTVYVPKKCKAAWIVEEGEVLTDTTTLITKLSQEDISSDGLYLPFTSKDEVVSMVEDFLKGE